MSISTTPNNSVPGENLKRSRCQEHLAILSETAEFLIAGGEPAAVVKHIFIRAATSLQLDYYFNFLSQDGYDAELHLHSFAGISEKDAKKLEHLRFGQAVCGTVAVGRSAMIFSSVQSRTDRLTSMIRKAGVNAYACFPLMAGQRLLGTISFGSRKRSSFDDDEIELLRTIAHHVALAQDRWRSEQVLAKALAEKEVLIRQQEILLREVNHRIKNNLQLVSSLLNMQGVNCGDSVAEEHLAKAARRVTAIAVVHDRLYQGADLENVDMADYIGDLCTQIATSTGADGRLKLKAELINLSADRAVPMAIILNELVTNALKHAYAPGQAGQVQVVLARSDTGIELVVEDAGRGMHPPSGEKPSKGLGMRVVTMLARQLNAQLSIEDAAPGTRFRLSLAS